MKFKVEAAEDRKRVVEEAVITLRERRKSELCEAVDSSIVEKEEVSDPSLTGGRPTLALVEAKSEVGASCEDEERIKRIR